MKPTKQLIRGLRETAQRLRDGNVRYEWNYQWSCNCGLLAQTLLDIDETTLCDRLETVASWSQWAKEAFCVATGLPLQEVARSLMSAGLERDDYAHIEFLHGASVDKRHFKNACHVAAWMDAEADKLEARRAAGERPERRQA